MKMVHASICFLLISTSVLAQTLTPVGYWKTIDDVTGKPKAIVQIVEDKDKTLSGRVFKVLTKQVQSVCSACPGNKHNQQIIGLNIIENLQPNHDKANEWQNGTILDPKNGKTYQCNVRLVDNGQKLNVRGYLGLPLFGRTQTWVKVNQSELVG